MTDFILRNGIALLALPELAATGCPEWDAAFAAYLTADALQRADMTIGRYGEILGQYHSLVSRLDKEHGQQRLDGGAYTYGNAQADADRREEYQRVSEIEEARVTAFLQPMWNASYALFWIPAPTLQAALFKLELAQHEELHLDENASGTVSAMDQIAADFARLQSSQPDPVTRYWAAFDAYNAAGYDENGDPLGDAEFDAATQALDDWVPATAYDFIRKFEAMHFEGGNPNEERSAILEREAAMILGHRSRRAQPVEA